VEGQPFINTSASIEDLIIPVGGKDPASQTSQVYLACNLDKRTPVIPPDAGPRDTLEGTWSTTFDIYDSFGNEHTLQIDFTRVPGIENRWQAEVTVDPEAEVATNTQIEVGAANNTTNTFFVDFSNVGVLQQITDAQGDALTTGDLQVPVSFDVLQAFAPPGTPPVRQTFTLNLGEVGEVTDTITQFAESSSTKVFEQDGYPMGYLEDFRVDQSGVITGVFSNGNNRALGQLALASFINPGGLEKAGENAFVTSNNSGEPDIGRSGIAGKGKVIAGALEMSNVDLAEQFTDMIVTQRGFQANSRSITTSDQMLQELLTLKR
jgi:flagellar hook protein FlgE